jgi:hypothetical protein
MNLKTINRWLVPRRGRKKPRHCEMDECRRATREGKPFCSDHVDHLPYVQQVRQRIADRTNEVLAVAQKGSRAVDPYGPIARDILLTLWINGERSVARLARELNLDFKLVQEYVKRLRRAKLVDRIPARRGAGKVKLIPALEVESDPAQIGKRPQPVQPVARPIRLGRISQADAASRCS